MEAVGLPGEETPLGAEWTKSVVVRGRMPQPVVLPGAHPEGWKQKQGGNSVTGGHWFGETQPVKAGKSD